MHNDGGIHVEKAWYLDGTFEKQLLDTAINQFQFSETKKRIESPFQK
jgi:hypothetical protein